MSYPQEDTRLYFSRMFDISAKEWRQTHICKHLLWYIEPIQPAKSHAWQLNMFVHKVNNITYGYWKYIDGLVQDCSNSNALEMELLQSYTKPLILSPITCI